MALGEYIKSKRTAAGMSRNSLAKAAGLSHTEIQRIEEGIRTQPSLKNLCAIADALNVPQEDMIKAAGFTADDDKSLVEKAFPSLKTEKQIETVVKIVDGLARSSDLDDEDLDGLYEQVKMFLNYANKTNNS